MLRPWLLRRAARQFHILPAKSNSDVDQIVGDILNYERREEKPPEIDPTDGWSPYLARDFLAEHGLRTNDYHKGYDEYWASANYVDLDDHILPNKATFYIEGEEDIVKTLKLTGKFRDEFDGELGMVKLRAIARTLCEKATGNAEIDLDALLPDADDSNARIDISGAAITTWAERYPSGKGYEVFLTDSR
jgi:hypothetical protein